jgi:hypothetical protein
VDPAVAKWVEKLPDEVRRARLGQGRGAFRTKYRAEGASWSRIPPLLLIACELNQPGAKRVMSVDFQHCIRGTHRRAGCRAAGLHPDAANIFPYLSHQTHHKRPEHVALIPRGAP